MKEYKLTCNICGAVVLTYSSSYRPMYCSECRAYSNKQFTLTNPNVGFFATDSSC